MWAKIIAIALISCVIVAAAIYALMWMVGALSGRLAGRGGIAPRLGPSVALLLAFAAALGPVILFGTGEFSVLGQPTFAGWLVYAISIAAPIAVVVATIIFVRTQKNRAATVMGVAQLAAAAIICAYLVNGGWFALKIWSM